jgi:hypothetical protein
MDTVGWLVMGGIAFLVLFALFFASRRAQDHAELPASSMSKVPPLSSDRTVRLKQIAERKERN